MKQILTDFYKLHASLAVGYALVDIFAIAGMVLTGLFTNEKLSWQAIAVTAFLCAVTLWYVLDVFVIAGAVFKKGIAKMSQKDARRLYKQYPNAKYDNGHRYMKDFLLFYRRRRIYAVKYADIIEMEGSRKNLTLIVKDNKKKLVVPFDMAGLNAIAMAFIRSKNPDVRVVRDDTMKDTDRKEL